MFENETRVLIILPTELVDRARGLAARTTISMKLPVSLQIVIRALIEEGLRRPTHPDLLANVSRQAQTVRRIRTEARRRPMTTSQRPHRVASRPRSRTGS